MELDEHGLVIDTLKEADETPVGGATHGWRAVGGADRQRGAACLENYKEQIQKTTGATGEQLQAKRNELNGTPGKAQPSSHGEDEKPAAKENSEGVGAKASSAGAVLAS